MFKIPFSGNSKVIDILQVTKFTKVGRLAKTTFQRGLWPNHTKDALYSTSEWGNRMYFD